MLMTVWDSVTDKVNGLDSGVVICNTFSTGNLLRLSMNDVDLALDIV